MDETHYGSVNVPRYSATNPNIRGLAAKTMAQWKSSGNKKSNILVFGSDLIGNEYGDNENAVMAMLGEYTLLQFMDDGDGWDFNMNDFTWGEIYYEAGILHYSLSNSLDHNIHRKDW